METALTHDEFQRRIADQDRRLGEALRILNDMRGEIPQELLTHVAREFERIADLTIDLSTLITIPAGVRA